MKLAWIVFDDEEDYLRGRGEFRTEQPENWYFKVIAIVYSELK